MPKNNQTTEIPNSNNLSQIFEEMVKLKDFTNRFAPLIVEYAKTIKAFGKVDVKEMRNNAHNIKGIADSINVFTKSVGVVMTGLKRLNDGIDIRDIEDLRKKLLTGESGGDVIVMKNIESKGNSSLDLTREITKSKVSNPGLIDIVAQVATLSGIMQSLQFTNPIKFRLKFLQTINLFKWQYTKLVEFSSAFDTKTIRTIKFATDGLQEVMMSIPSTVSAMTSVFSNYGESKIGKRINRGIKVLLGDNMDGTGGVVWSILLLGEQLNKNPLNQSSIDSFRDVMKSFGMSIKEIANVLTLIALTWPMLKLGAFVLFGHGGKKPGLVDTLVAGMDLIAGKENSIKTAAGSISWMASSLLAIVGCVSLISLVAPLVMLSSVTIFALSIVIKGLMSIYSMVADSNDDIIDSSSALTHMVLSLLAIVGSVSLISMAAPLVLLSLATIIPLTWVVGRLLHIYSMVADSNDDIIGASGALKQMATSLLVIVGSVSAMGLATPMVTLSIITVLVLSLVVGRLVHIYSIVAESKADISGASSTLKQMATSMLAFIGSLVIIGLTFMIAAPLIAVAVVATLTIVGLMVLMGRLAKNIDEGGAVLKDMSLAMLMLSATALLMTVTGRLIMDNWEGVLAVSAYLLVLVGSCMLLALAKKIINDGSKELLHLTLAIMVLAGTAMLMAVVGQFITANWGNMLIMSAFILVLIGSCMLLSLAKNWIEGGAKELLFIALTVAILAGVAALMILVGGMLTINWEPVLAVTLLLTVLIGASYLIAAAGKTIQKGWVAMLTVVLFAAAMASVVYILAKVSNTADPLKLLEVVGIMSLIMATVGAITIAAGALLAGPQAIIFGLGVAAMGTLSMVALLLAEVMDNTAKAATAVRSAGLDDPDEAASIISLPIKVFTKKDKDGKSLFGYIADLPNPVRMALYTDKVTALAEIAVSVGGIAGILQHIASLNMPDPAMGFTEDGMPKGFKAMTSDDFRNAAVNTGSILTFFSNIFGEKSTTMEFAGQRIVVTPISMAALDNLSGGTKRKVARLGRIISVVGGMAETLRNMSSLVVPDAMGPEDFNENGTPKKWRQMTAGDISNAALTAGSMLGFFCALFGDERKTLSLGSAGAVMVNPISGGALDNISRNTMKKMKHLGRIISVVGGMGETIKNLAGMTVPDTIGPEDFNENGTPKRWRRMTDVDFNNAMRTAERMMLSVVNILGDDAMSDRLSSISRRNMRKIGVAMDAVNGLGNIMDLIKELAGGRMASKWRIDNNPNSPTYGQEIPIEYINIIDYIDKNNDRIKRTVYDIIMCPISAVAWVSSNKSVMGQIKDAGKAGDMISDVFNTIKRPVSGVIDLYNDKLAGVDAGAIRSTFEGMIFGIMSPLADLDPDRMKSVKNSSLVVFERVAASMADGSRMTDKAANNFQTNVRETVGLIKAVDSRNLDKLKTASELMRHISELSKSINGNFKELAKAIKEDLLEALEKLTGALDGVNGKDFKVSVAGDVISKPSGSAGLAERRESQPLAGSQLTKADLDRIIRFINELSTKINRVITPDNKVQVKM